MIEFLVLENISKSFGGVRAVDGVNLSIHDGELTSIIGPNGAGKTTLANLIAGLLVPDSGRIFLRGKEVTTLSAEKRAKEGIALSFQIPDLFNKLTAMENIMLPLLAKGGRAKVITRLASEETDIRNDAVKIIELFKLGALREKRAGSLTQSEKKLLDAAVSFAQGPKLLILDEPTRGLGSGEKESVMDTIVDAVTARKMSVIIVEHDMDLVFRYSQQVMVMYQGRVITEGPPEFVRDSEEFRKVLIG